MRMEAPALPTPQPMEIHLAKRKMGTYLWFHFKPTLVYSRLVGGRGDDVCWVVNRHFSFALRYLVMVCSDGRMAAGWRWLSLLASIRHHGAVMQ